MKLIPRWVEEHFSGILSERSKRSSLTSGNNAIRIQERILVLPQQHPHRNSTPAAVTHHEVQQLSSSHNSSKNEMMSTSVIQSSSCSSKSGNESRDRDARRTSRQLQFLQLHHERLQQNRHFLLRHHEHEQVQPNHEVQANITREEQETLNENPVFQQNNRRISSSVYDRRPTETTDIVSSKHHLVRRPTPTKRTPTKNVLRGRHAVQQNHHREKRHALFLDNGKQDDSDEELMDDLCDQRKHPYFTQRQPSHRHHLRSHDNNHLRRPVINQCRPLLLEESYNQPCNRHSPLSTPVIRASSSTPSSMMNRVTNNQWTQRSSVNSSILHLQEKHRQEPSSSSSRRVSSSSNRNYILKENDDSEDDDYDDPYCPSNVAAASTIEMMMTSKENAAFEKEEYLTVFMSNNHNRNASRSKTATAAVKTTQTSSKKKKQNSSFIASSSSSSTSHSPSTRIESRVTKGNSRTRDSINSSNSNRRNSKTAAAKNTAVDQQRSSAQSVVKMMLSQTHRNDSGSSCSTSPASSVSSSAGKARERSGIKTNPWLESPWMPQSSQSIVDDTSSSIDSPSSSTADSGCSLLSIQNRCNTSDINNRTASSSVVNNSLTITRRKITPSKNSAFDVVNNNNKEVNDNDNIYSRRSTASSSSCMTTSTLHDNTSNRSSTHSNILRLPSINYNELLNDLTNFTNLNDSMNLSDKLLQLCISRENNSTEEIMTPLEMKSSSSGISSVDQNAMLSPGDDANFISNRNSFIFSSDESNRNSFVDSDDAVMTALMASQESMMTSSSSSNSLVLLPPPPDQDYSRTILANFLHNMISTNNDSKTTVTEKKTGKEETSVRYNGPLNGSDSTSYSFLRRETAGQRMTNDSVMKMKEETDNGNNHYNRNHGLHSPSNDRQGVDDDMLDDTNGNRLERQEVTASLVKEDLDKDLRCNDRLEDVFGHQPILLRRKQTSKYSGLDNRKQAHLTSECIAGRNEIKVDNDDNHHLLDGVSSTPQEPATAGILLHSPKLLSFSRNEGQERKSSSPQKETSRLSFPCSSSETTMKSVARKEALFPELPASSLRRQPENEDIKETLERTQENGKKLDDSLGLLGDKTVKEDKHETEDILASFSSLTRSFDEQFYAGCKRQGEENSNDKTSQASSSRHSFASDRPSSLSSCQSYSSDFKNFLQIKKDASSAGSSLMSVMTGSSSSGLESATSSFTDSSVSAGRRYYSSLWNKRRFTPSVSTLREVGNPSVRRRIRNEEWVSTATEELVDQLFE